MIKRFIKDSIIYSIPSFLAKALSIFLVPLYTRVLAPSDYGIIDIIKVLSSMVILIVPMEVAQALARFVPDKNDDTDKKDLFSSALNFTVLAFVLFTILCILFLKPLTNLILDSTEHSEILLLSIFAISLEGISILLRNELRFELRSKENVIINIIFIILNPLITVSLLVGFGFGVRSVYFGLIGSHLVCIGTALIFLRKSLILSFNIKVLKKLLKFSIPFVPSSIGVIFAGYIDRVTIKTLMTMGDVGVYGVGYRIASVIGLLLTGVQLSITPLIYCHYQDVSFKENISKIFTYFSLLSIILFVGLSVFSKELFYVFVGKQYIDGYKLLPFLVPAILFSKLYIFFPGLGIEKKTKIIAVINILVAVLNLILNIIFIPIWGILGAAVATLLGNTLGFLAMFFTSQKVFYYKIEFKKILIAALSASLLVAVVFNFINSFLFLKILIVIGYFLILSFFYIDKNDLIKLKSL